MLYRLSSMISALLLMQTAASELPPQTSRAGGFSESARTEPTNDNGTVRVFSTRDLAPSTEAPVKSCWQKLSNIQRGYLGLLTAGGFACIGGIIALIEGANPETSKDFARGGAAGIGVSAVIAAIDGIRKCCCTPASPVATASNGEV